LGVGLLVLRAIGKRAATIEDRSITIALKRKLPGEKVERLRHVGPELFGSLVRKLARFADDNVRIVAAGGLVTRGHYDDRRACEVCRTESVIMKSHFEYLERLLLVRCINLDLCTKKQP
jgi:hypothetical protein